MISKQTLKHLEKIIDKQWRQSQEIYKAREKANSKYEKIYKIMNKSQDKHKKLLGAL
jgi:hypothetical protein